MGIEDGLDLTRDDEELELELDAMRRVVHVMDDLDGEQQKRVIYWVVDRLGITL